MHAFSSSSPRLWAWLGIGAAAGFLLWLLSPILAPFLLAGILAYVLDPLVGRLARWRVRRPLGALLVLAAAALTLVGALLVVLPLFWKELRLLIDLLPRLLVWANETVRPFLERELGIELALDAESLRAAIGEAIRTNRDVMQRVLGSLSIGGMAVLGFVANMLLVPVVAFYLLRDWHAILARLERMVPRPLYDTTLRLAREIDLVLAEFLRGQLLVILVMSTYYVAALWLAGLEFALPVGIITGALTLIPYVGAATGYLLGTVAAILQFDAWQGVLLVVIAFALGQFIESFVVTPRLVGERIGLHPVAVLFALLAFGQVFGFFGVLLALPAAAVLLIGLREARRRYLDSTLYLGDDRSPPQ